MSIEQEFQAIPKEDRAAYAREFRFALRDTGAMPRDAETTSRPFLVVIGGAPGSGKTTVARNLSELGRLPHVQSNSARHFLKSRGLSWGENVRSLIGTVIEDLMERGYSVICDGGVLENKEREKLREVSKGRLCIIAVTCDLDKETERAKARFSDGKESTFEDWRPSPRLVSEYFESMKERSEKLEQMISEEKPSPIVINNDGTLKELTDQVREAWKKIQRMI